MQVKLWKHEGGKALMAAVGFGPPVESVSDGKMKSFVALSAVTPAAHSDKSKKRLPAEVVEAMKCRRKEIEQEVISLEGAPSVSAAIRSMRQTHSLVEVRTGVETALSIVRNVLRDPKDIKLHRVKRSNPVFQRTLGRLSGSELLMRAVGFLDGDASESPDNAAYVLKSSSDGHASIGTERTKGAGWMTMRHTALPSPSLTCLYSTVQSSRLSVPRSPIKSHQHTTSDALTLPCLHPISLSLLIRLSSNVNWCTTFLHSLHCFLMLSFLFILFYSTFSSQTWTLKPRGSCTAGRRT